MPLFTEYERQFKRKYPGMQCAIQGWKTDDKEPYNFAFELIDNGEQYIFKMTAPYQAKNGYIECSLKLFSGPYIKEHTTIEFDESRKPMEMNIDNAIHTAKFIIKSIKE